MVHASSGKAPACQRAAAIRTRNSRRHSSRHTAEQQSSVDYDHDSPITIGSATRSRPCSRISRISTSASGFACGFRLPLPPTMRCGTPHPARPNSSSFKGVVEDVEIAAPDVLKLTTIRSHDQYNTTIYGLDDRYRGVFGRRDVPLRQ